MTFAIKAEGLVKVYGKERVLEGIDVEVPEGSIFGLLGPNGAGKTTTVRILATLLRPDEGRATVGGWDVVKDAGKVRQIIGLSGQYAAVDEYLSGRENLEIFGRLYRLSKREALARTEELLTQFDLASHADRQVKTYSGGLRRRLDLAASLIGRPQVVFLDEPTTGLDLPSRLAMWEMVRRLAREGTTVLLTTQYLEEADQLADQLLVIAEGKVIAEGPPAELKGRVGERLEVVVRTSEMLEPARSVLQEVSKGEAVVDPQARRISVPVSGGASLIAATVRDFDLNGVALDDIALRQPTLDDAFLVLTGHGAQAVDAEGKQ